MAIENLLSAPSGGLAELYDRFRQEHLVALWTEIGDLMPASPRSRAVPHLWRWPWP
jgi:gentisate 1,2-dioxygenase